MRSREEEFYESARVHAHWCGRRFGLTADQAGESAQAFVVGLLRFAERAPWTWPQAYRQRYLYCAVRHHTLNVVREIGDRMRRCVPLDVEMAAEDERSAPDRAYLRGVIRTEIRSALKRLTALQRTLFQRFHLEEATVAEIATELGMGQHAVQQRLSHARKRLGAVLVSEGYTGGELRSYLDGPPNRAAGIARIRLCAEDDEANL